MPFPKKKGKKESVAQAIGAGPMRTPAMPGMPMKPMIPDLRQAGIPARSTKAMKSKMKGGG